MSKVNVMVIHEIATEIYRLKNLILENEGAISPEIEKELNAWQGAFDFKLANAGALVLQMREERKRLKEHLEKLDRAEDWLVKYCHSNMLTANLQKIESNLARLSICKNPPHVEPLADAELFYKENPASPFVRRIPASYEWDKKAILEASKNGGVPEEWVTITQSTSLRIK